MTEFEARSRWSTAVVCPRQAAYGLRGEVGAEPDELTKGYWARGKQIGAWMASRFVERYGEHDVVLEKAIPWPAGIAHGDIFVRSEGLAVEVKSLSDPRPLDSHLLQLAGQIVFDPEAERGALALVNPSSLQVRTLPMPVVPDALVERVHDVAREVAAAADPSAPLPERVCARPSEARGRMCPFERACFGDWEVPDPIDLRGEVATLGTRLVEIEERLREAKTIASEIEQERDEVRAAMRLTLEPAREYSIDDERLVRITPVAGRVTYDVATAIKMGVVDEDQMEPFRREGKGFERWTLGRFPTDEPEPVGPLPSVSDEDFGAEAPF